MNSPEWIGIVHTYTYVQYMHVHIRTCMYTCTRTRQQKIHTKCTPFKSARTHVTEQTTHLQDQTEPFPACMRIPYVRTYKRTYVHTYVRMYVHAHKHTYIQCQVDYGTVLCFWLELNKKLPILLQNNFPFRIWIEGRMEVGESAMIAIETVCTHIHTLHIRTSGGGTVSALLKC